MCDDTSPPTFRVAAMHFPEGTSDEVSVGFEMTNWRGSLAKPQAFAHLMPTEQAMRDYPMGKVFRLVPVDEEARR